MNIRSAGIISRTILAGLSAMVVACSNSEKNDFTASCVQSKSGDVSACECLYELGQENLSDEQMELFVATFLEDDMRIAQARTKLGIISGAAAAAKLGWVIANAGDACGVKL